MYVSRLPLSVFFLITDSTQDLLAAKVDWLCQFLPPTLVHINMVLLRKTKNDYFQLLVGFSKTGLDKNTFCQH